MTLATEIRGALVEVLELLLREFGVTATLRRPSSTKAADKTPITLTPAVGGAPSPTTVLLFSQKRVDVQKVFGQETEAEVVGLCRDNVPVLMKDRFELLSGMSASSTSHYQVTELEPVDAGGFWLLGLTKVPALPAS